MLLSNPELLTERARRALGADLSLPATHEEVEKLMRSHKPGRSRRAGKQKNVRGATLVRSRREQSASLKQEKLTSTSALEVLYDR
jgi:hypothetical protein